jgi:hypothetical protein
MAHAPMSSTPMMRGTRVSVRSTFLPGEEVFFIFNFVFLVDDFLDIANSNYIVSHTALQMIQAREV